MDSNKLEKNIKLSFIIPIYSSERSIPYLLKRLEKLEIEDSWEVIFVEDGSPDNSYKTIFKLLKKSTLNAKLIRHNRNYGEHQAVLTGYRYSSGNYVVNLDDDLQNPPEEALKLFRWAEQKNLDVVYGVQERRKGKIFEKLSGALFYNFIVPLCNLEIPKLEICSINDLVSLFP